MDAATANESSATATMCPATPVANSATAARSWPRASTLHTARTPFPTRAVGMAVHIDSVMARTGKPHWSETRKPARRAPHKAHGRLGVGMPLATFARRLDACCVEHVYVAPDAAVHQVQPVGAVRRRHARTRSLGIEHATVLLLTDERRAARPRVSIQSVYKRRPVEASEAVSRVLADLTIDLVLRPRGAENECP